MAKPEGIKRQATCAWPGFEDKIRDARYTVAENRFVVTFESGREYSFPRSVLDSDDGTEIVSVKVGAKRFFFQVSQASGNKYEVPWDRVLYEAEPRYPFFHGHAGRAEGFPEAGKAIRRLRLAKGMTQAQLARAAGIVRPNLCRVEGGKHRPTLQTLERIAAALKVPVVDLIVRKRVGG